MLDDDVTRIYAIGALGLCLFLWLVLPALDSRPWRVAADLSANGLITALFSIGIFALFVDIQILPVLVVAIAVHEYGHVLAFRLAGHSAPVFRLVPLGGVAMSTEAPRSQQENVFVALMGPGFSVVLLIAAALTFLALRDSDPFGARYALVAAGIVGVLNLFNLLPLFPLDGGKALRAIATIGGQSFATGLSLALSAAIAALAITSQLWILLIFAAFGLMAAAQPNPLDERLPPISAGKALLSLLAYLSLVAVHGWASFPLLFDIYLQMTLAARG